MEKKQYRVLVVDDNPSIHADFRKILSAERNIEDEAIRKASNEFFGNNLTEDDPLLCVEYELDFALQGKEGLRLVEESLIQKRPYALAFVDVLMPPGWDGVETIKYIWEKDPEIQVVICTAYAEYSWSDIIKNLGISDNLLILKKPFEIIEIRQLACCLTKKWQLNKEAGHVYDRLHEEIIKETKVLKDMFDRLNKNLDKIKGYD